MTGFVKPYVYPHDEAFGLIDTPQTRINTGFLKNKNSQLTPIYANLTPNDVKLTPKRVCNLVFQQKRVLFLFMKQGSFSILRERKYQYEMLIVLRMGKTSP